LSDLFEMRAGKFIAASGISKVQDADHPYPCFGGGGLRGYVGSANEVGEKVLIGRQGALCGNVLRTAGKFYATEHAVVVIARPNTDIRWAYHALTAMNLNQYASRSAQPGLAVGTLEKLRIPVPPLAEQAAIAEVLDKFDALVSGLSIGLSAELRARRRQYEYYRDRLLTFAERVA
jgi:type I restriction enzyme S subunit